MKRLPKFIILLLSVIFTTALSRPIHTKQVDNPNPPAQPVKLIFIHHSTGENWLTDGYGDLGRELAKNNYFVSDTNYGWGPDSIGDRTDIPDWLEWFRGEHTARYLQALFTEGGQNSSYTRSFEDPGGENQIVMFKSCFPNSALEGHPNDPPDSDGWLSVGHAKYVYIELLKYFATRPDKLFVVIAAPPLQDASLAQNARAFNEWLLNDWLRENNYILNNVVVFDFFTVLTGPDHYHRYANGQVVHYFKPNQNTSYYPTSRDDDHPSVEGSRKATKDFVPLLNVFYNRWKASAPAAPPAAADLVVTPQPVRPVEGLPASAVLDDFEGASSWEAFTDEGGATTMVCFPDSAQAHGGAQALRIDFKVAAPSGWATCAYIYPSAQDWSSASGLSFYLHSAKAGQVFHVDLYAQSGGERESYFHELVTGQESVSGWVPVQIRWEEFHRVDWEANAGAPFAKPAQVEGLAFGIPSQEAASEGQIWLDDLALWEAAQVAGPTATVMPVSPPAPKPSVSEPTPVRNPLLPVNCPGSAAFPLAVFAGLWLIGRKRR
jgi:hypothetical protein